MKPVLPVVGISLLVTPKNAQNGSSRTVSASLEARTNLFTPAGYGEQSGRTPNRSRVFPIENSSGKRGGTMSGITIKQHERSQIIWRRLIVKFFVTPVVFYTCWRASTCAIALAPEEMSGLGWRCLSSLTAAGVAASFAVSFVHTKSD